MPITIHAAHPHAITFSTNGPGKVTVIRADLNGLFTDIKAAGHANRGDHTIDESDLNEICKAMNEAHTVRVEKLHDRASQIRGW